MTREDLINILKNKYKVHEYVRHKFYITIYLLNDYKIAVISYKNNNLDGYIVLDNEIYVNNIEYFNKLTLGERNGNVVIGMNSIYKGSMRLERFLARNVLNDAQMRVSFKEIDGVVDIRKRSLTITKHAPPIKVIYLDNCENLEILHSTIPRSIFKYTKIFYKLDEDTCLIDIFNNRLDRRVQFKIDIEDLDNITQHPLMISQATDGNFYLRIGLHSKTVHRFITGVSDLEVIDHLNRDTKDNRKSNLKVTDSSGNSRNVSLRKNSVTGVKGVTIGNVRGHLSYVSRCNIKGVGTISKTFSISKYGDRTAFDMAVTHRNELEKKFGIK